MCNIKSSINHRLIIITYIVLYTTFSYSEPSSVGLDEVDPTTTSTAPLMSIDKWGVSRINVKKTTYAWTILNFSVHGKGINEYLESPPFSMDQYKWSLRFWPTLPDGRYTRLYLVSLPGSWSGLIPITYQFGLVNSTNDFYYPSDVAKSARVSPNKVFGNDYFIQTSSLKNFTQNDQLTIIAKIAINTGYTNTSGSCGMVGLDTSDYDHTENFENMLDNAYFSDIIFKIGQTEIKAHRAVLAEMSPVLMAEFVKLTELQRQAVFEIDDVEPKIFKEMLRFVYTGKVEKIEKIAKDLLPLANRFEIKELKSICERVLCRSLNSENAMDIFNLANNTDATYLKVQAMKYIKTYAESIMDTPILSSLISHPQNLFVIIHALINNSTF